MSLYVGFPITSKLRTSSSITERSVGAFLSSIEAKTGSKFISEEDTDELQPLFVIAHRLRESGIIRDLYRTHSRVDDEPHIYAWRGVYSDNDSSGGASAVSDFQALVSTLAEAVERYLWRFDASALARSIVVSENDLVASRKRFVPIAHFAGFSSEQRAKHKALRVQNDTPLRWVEASDLLSGGYRYIPAQTITGAHDHSGPREPLIRPVITTGLATGVTRENALVAGVLEIIERDAFMIMWLNQLTYPRVDIASLAHTHEELRTLLEKAASYSLSIDVVRMETDAPAHAVIAIVRDVAARPTAPFIVGMGCRQSLPDAAAHAILEALRIRENARTHYAKLDAARIIPKDIRHTERVPYWLHAERWHGLEFLCKGEMAQGPGAAWESDSQSEYLSRIKEWCTEKKYSLLSLDLGRSKKNPTQWHVESVVIPEMQPLHIVERYQCLGGQRLKEIPRMFGYTPRTEPFSEEPHPFA